MRLVTLIHPDLDTEIEVPEVAVRIHERSGWRPKFSQIETTTLSSPEPSFVDGPLADAWASMTLADLRQYAAERGVDLGGATRKADVRAAIQEFEASASDDKAPAPVADNPTTTTNSPDTGEES